MIFYEPKHFKLYEWLPPDIHKQLISRYPNKIEYGWSIFFDPRILWTFDQLRARYGKIIMNDWWWRHDDPGANCYRGWRPPKVNVGAEWSQHRFGRAGDGVMVETTAKQVRQDILDNPWDVDFNYITCIEMNIPWLHIDCRNWDKRNHGILQVWP